MLARTIPISVGSILPTTAQRKLVRAERRDTLTEDADAQRAEPDGVVDDHDDETPADDSGDGAVDEEAAEESDDEVLAPPAGRRRPRRNQCLAGVGVVVVVALLAGAFFLGRGSSPSTSRHPTASGVPPGFVTFRSRADGFRISYPKQWQVVTDPSVPLLLSAGGNDALQIRVLTLQSAVNTKDVASIRAVTDSILSTPSAHLHVLGTKPITIAGVGGYYYLYTFPTDPSGAMGVHAHYFLFQGRKLTMLVFQALPIGDFQRLAPIFDQVSATFHSDPSILPPPPPPATTAPGSTAPGTTAPAPGSTTPGTTGPAPGSTAPVPTAPAPTVPASPPSS